MGRLQKNGAKVRLFGWAVGFANWLATIPNRMTPPPFRLMQIGSAFWQSRALYVAARLELADELAGGSRSCSELAETLALHEENLYRLLRMLASLGIFREEAQRRFSNSRLSECLRRDHPQSVRAMILMHNSPEMTRPWVEGLEPAIRTGEVPFVSSHGELLFDYMDHHPQFDELFSRAMDAVESLTGTDYLHDFDWSEFDRLIDVGGSQGGKAMSILQANPGLKALVFDRQQVVAGAREHWQTEDPSAPLERIEFVAGDMFAAIPPALNERDIYLFVAVFHSLCDEDALKVLQRLQQAMAGSGATALIVDTVVAETGIDPNHAAFDMQMLIGTQGRERTLREWSALLARGGFAISEIVDVRTFAKFIVISPQADGG